jgi:hypothetical protein
MALYWRFVPYTIIIENKKKFEMDKIQMDSKGVKKKSNNWLDGR